MNALHIIPNIFHPHLGRRDVVEDLAGATLRDVAREYKPREWGATPLHMALNGRGYFEKQLDDVRLKAGDHVILSRDLLGIEAAAAIGVTGFWGLVVGTAINAAFIYGVGLAARALQGSPKPAKTLSDKDSQTSALSGISTSQIPGLPIGIPYGSLRVGGQKISEFSTQIGLRDEVYGILLALGYGPIARVAGIDLTLRQERNRLGSLYGGQHGIVEIPSGIRINGAAVSMGDANLALRAGTLHQTPVPGYHRGTSLSVVAKQLRSGSPQRFSIAATTVRVQPRVFFNQLFRQQANGGIGIYAVQVQIDFLNASGQVVGAPFTWNINPGVPMRNGFATSVLQDVPAGATQVRLTRLTADDTFDTFSECSWTNLVEEFSSAELAYPGIALAALDLRATEQFVGNANNITMPIWGRMLKWRLAGVWQAATFFDSITSKWVGRNPAWQAYDFLTMPYGLGLFGIDDTKLDLAALELWSEHNDVLVPDGHGGQHPQFHCDVNIDAPRRAWDWHLDICKAGRAFPWFFGDRITWKFQRATTLVGFENPIRSLISESNVAELNFETAETRFRPTIFEAQIQDESIDFEQNPIKAVDPEAAHVNEPWKIGYEPPIRENRDLVGYVRSQQARRDLRYEHNVNRKRWLIATGVSGWDALALEPGDLFYLQSDIPRWFGKDTGGWRMTRSGTAVTNVFLDHAVTLAPATTYEVLVTRSDGTPQIVAVTAAPGTYPADTAIAIDPSKPQTYRKGAVVAFGEQSLSSKIFEMREIEALENMRIRWRAQLWDDTVFDVGIPEPSDNSLADFGPYTSETIPAAATIVVAPSSDGRGHRVGWAFPDTNRSRARVYVRRNRSSNPALSGGVLITPYDDGRWQRIYDGEANDALIPDLAPFAPYDVAVTVQAKSGRWSAPEEAAVTVTPEEFPPLPPGSVQGLRASNTAAGVELRWTPLAEAGIRDYEVRRGSNWLGGQLVARTTEPRVLVQDAPVGGQSYLVAARAACGLYSPVIARVSINVDPPAAFPAADVTVLDLASTAIGTHDGTELAADGSVQIQRGRASGTYTMPIVDAGRVGPYWWSLNWSWRWRDVSGAAANVLVGSGESHWWRITDTGDGREPTPGKPGVDFDLRLAPDGVNSGFGTGFSDGFGTGPSDIYSRVFTWADAAATSLSGPFGAVGHHARVVAEVRWDDGSGTWSRWERWRQQVRVASRAQFRFVLDRENAYSFDVFLDPYVTACACAKMHSAELVVGADGAPQQRFTITNPAVTADSRIVGNVVRPNVTDDEDNGVTFRAQVLQRQAGSFDVLICAEDLDGGEADPIAAGEILEFHYSIG